MLGTLALDRHGPLGRFDARTETDYRRWLERRMLPLATALGLTSALAWLLAPPLTWVLAPDDVDLQIVAIVCWGVNVTTLVIGITWVRRAAGRHLVGLGTLAIALTACDGMYVVAEATDATALTFLAAGIFYGMLAPMAQLPFRETVALTLLTFVLATWVWSAQEDQAWNISQSLIFITMTIAVLMVVPAMAFVSERESRDAYASEQIIEQQRALIRRYAPSSVVSRIEQGDATVGSPQRRKVTIFFSDVVGFTSMADRVDPEALAAIVNEYLGSLADLVERHGGTLNEFAGDGVMAIFGAPDEMEPADQVRSAIAAARDLQTSLPRWSKDWYEHGIVDDLLARVGINTGTVSVGTFGSAVRATYTGIGLQTNIAARVQAQAPPGGILLSNTSWHLVKDTVACEPRGEVTVKGVHFPIELYEPVTRT